MTWRGARAGVRLEHLRGERRDDRGGEARSVDVLVGARDHVVVPDLRRHELAHERAARGGRRRRGRRRCPGPRSRSARSSASADDGEAGEERRLLRRRGAGQDGRGHPDPRRDHLGLLEPVDGGPVARVVHVVVEKGRRFLSSRPPTVRTDGAEAGGMTGWPGLVAEVARRGHDEETGARRRLGGLRERRPRGSSPRSPPRSSRSRCGCRSAAGSGSPTRVPRRMSSCLIRRAEPTLTRTSAGLGREAAVEAPGEPAVPARHDRRHHAVPARLVGPARGPARRARGSFTST